MRNCCSFSPKTSFLYKVSKLQFSTVRPAPKSLAASCCSFSRCETVTASTPKHPFYTASKLPFPHLETLLGSALRQGLRNCRSFSPKTSILYGFETAVRHASPSPETLRCSISPLRHKGCETVAASPKGCETVALTHNILSIIRFRHCRSARRSSPPWNAPLQLQPFAPRIAKLLQLQPQNLLFLYLPYTVSEQPFGTFRSALQTFSALRPFAAASAQGLRNCCSFNPQKLLSIRFRNCRSARFSPPWNAPLQLQPCAPGVAKGALYGVAGIGPAVGDWQVLGRCETGGQVVCWRGKDGNPEWQDGKRGVRDGRVEAKGPNQRRVLRTEKTLSQAGPGKWVRCRLAGGKQRRNRREGWTRLWAKRKFWGWSCNSFATLGGLLPLVLQAACPNYVKPS